MTEVKPVETTAIDDDIQAQKKVEGRMIQIWDTGFKKENTIEEIFGSLESWMLQIGKHTLLLNPVLKEWFYLDKGHQTWEASGFGPGEVIFIAFENLLGYRGVQENLKLKLDAPDDRELIKGNCTNCGERVKPDHKFCGQCGAPLRRNQEVGNG